MFSVPVSAATRIVSSCTAWSAAALQVETRHYVLESVDDALSVAALALLAAILAAAFARRTSLSLLDAPHRPNRVREDAVALVIMAYLTGYVVATGVVQAASCEAEGLTARMVTGASAQLTGIVACLYVGATRFDGGFVWGKGAARRRSVALLAVGLTLLSLGLCPLVRDGTVLLILHFAPGYEFNSHPTIDALHDGGHSIVMVIGLWFSAAVMAPLAEELFFRGLLQTFLGNLLRSRRLAIGLASIAFGAVHVGQPHAVAALVLLGVLLGYAYERTGSLALAIVIHALFNLKTLIWDAMSPAAG